MHETSLRGSRNLLETDLQAIVRDAFATGYLQGYGRRGYRSENCELYCQQIQEVVTSYFDRGKSDAGAQDEASETRTFGFTRTPIEEAYDEIVTAINYRIPHGEVIKPIGHCKLTEKPDGSIHASIKFGSTKPQVNGAI